MYRNPYASAPQKAFWRVAVASVEATAIGELWQPKFSLRHGEPVLTAGSCFAQHFGKALREQGFNWHETEPAPPKVSDKTRRDFNYGLFSFRTGNIYTSALLRQWLEWAFGKQAMPDEIWEQDQRFYDPFRPRIEPTGFASVDELQQARRATLDAIREGVSHGRLFVFTLGLTEAWANRKTGLVYPMCPGTTGAGRYDERLHEFRHLSFQEILNDLEAVRGLLKEANPQIRMLLTVSPVPLTATASGEHVLVATVHSKSILRAVAGAFAHRYSDVDYFPSYEVITGIPFRSMFYESNLRSVSPEGVAFVMKMFFDAQSGAASAPQRIATEATSIDDVDAQKDVVCEDLMLDEFGPA